jgi:Flp pilus assembly protein TadG
MTHREDFRTGFLKRLVKDSAGNTIAIVAASTLPMLAMVGGGVDISRAYMTKTQLQSACDAGVLAGRRAMSKTSEYSSAEKAKANAMFNFNLNASGSQAEDVSFTSSDNDDGQVLGSAEATMPTTIMKIFGKTDIDLSVDCMAELQLANVDVMFVLDVTGSMGSPASKIQGLRDAVRDFHSTLAGAIVSEDTRVRYGFVPYSTTVNAKDLLNDSTYPMSKNYFVSTAPYQTKVAAFDVPGYPVKTKTTPDPTTANDSSISSQNTCNNKSDQTSVSGSAPSNTVTTVNSWSWSNKKCVKTTTTTTRTYYNTPVFFFSGWKYKQDSINTANFKNFSSVPLVTDLTSGVDLGSSYLATKGEYDMEQLGALASIPGATKSSFTWNGCLEERNTVQTDDFDPVPDGAYDLDLNLEPDSDQTRWKPMWPAVEYYRGVGVSQATSGTAASAPCPSPMQMFRTIEMSSTTVPGWLNTYLNNLVATGNTYHDIGMIWGGRLGSSRSVFADNVNEGIEEGTVKSVSRHLVFMTDGVMEPARQVYNAYGVEQNDNRIGPSGASNTDLAAIHGLRFRAACDAAKAEGFIIYVVGFGTSITDDLKYCSTDNRYYYAKDTTKLRDTFKFIASQVADLRLGQ